jgi:hypothetical protein
MKTPNCLGREYIWVEIQNGETVLSTLGENAAKYVYVPELRKRADECWESALRSTNRYYVLRGATVIAAQPNLATAREYAQTGDVIFEITHDDVCNELFRRLDALQGDARVPILRLLKQACNVRLGMQVKRGDPVPSYIPEEVQNA